MDVLIIVEVDCRESCCSGSLFYTDPAKWVAEQLEESRAYSFLLQRVSVQVQRGNAADIGDFVLDYVHCFIYLMLFVVTAYVHCFVFVSLMLLSSFLIAIVIAIYCYS